MTRKSEWLPGADGIEPGGDRDRDFMGYPMGRLPPLADIISGVVLVVCAIGVGVFMFAAIPSLNLPAAIIGGVGIAVFLGVAVFYFLRGGRRWAWRKSHIAETGGRYLRPWERYRPSDWMR